MIQFVFDEGNQIDFPAGINFIIVGNITAVLDNRDLRDGILLHEAVIRASHTQDLIRQLGDIDFRLIRVARGREVIKHLEPS